MSKNINYTDNNVYCKMSNGRYKPIGIRTTEEYITDGIWRVKHHEYGGTQTTRMDYLTGLYKLFNSQKIDLRIVGGLEDIYDEITHSDEFLELMHSERGYCPADIVRLTLAYIYKKQNKEI